jgi:hypothetical protein
MFNGTRPRPKRVSADAPNAKQCLLVVARLAIVTSVASISPGCAAAHVVPGASGATTHIGPGPAEAESRLGNDSLTVRVWPNRATSWNAITLSVTRRGEAMVGAAATLSFTMPAMAMGAERFRLVERRPGVYSYLGPALVMPGRWDLRFTITPSHERPFAWLAVDHVAP